MRYMALSLVCLMTACVGKVEGKPWSVKTDKAPVASLSDCLKLRGSKYAVCGAIDGDAGITADNQSTGTTYAVRGDTHAR